MAKDVDMSLVFNFTKQYRLNYEACSERLMCFISSSPDVGWDGYINPEGIESRIGGELERTKVPCHPFLTLLPGIFFVEPEH